MALKYPCVVCGGNFTTFILDLNTESSSQLLYPSRQSKAGRIDPLKSSQVTGDVSDSEWKTLVLVLVIQLWPVFLSLVSS